ncbi:hypothetical protein PG275_09265 [Riemerella anatipestifer]|nr:hypothetical protein [Riemerella anatipestifer]
MKKSILNFSIITLVIAGLVSCDDKVRELTDLDQAPSFLYFNSKSVNWEEAPFEPIIDSAKVYSSSNNSSYPVILKVVDKINTLTELKILTSDPENSIFVNNNLYTTEYVSASANEDINCAFRSSKAGTQEFIVSSTSIFDKRNTFKFRIEFKENRPPKANLKIALIDSRTKNYKLDASGSEDIDKAIGGAIVEYEFIINNILIKTTENSINHIFKTGTHEIKVRVKDNDDVWSEYVSETLVVQ